MDHIIDRRIEIYNYFQANVACQNFFLNNKEIYVAYYNSMYLLQDSTESLWQHREKGFSNDPRLAYIEFWGVMQAVIIQQDAIKEIYKVITGKEFECDRDQHSSWYKIRNLRNICAGHPAKKGNSKKPPLIRSFMGRNFGNYELFTYERWEDGERTHPEDAPGSHPEPASCGLRSSAAEWAASTIPAPSTIPATLSLLVATVGIGLLVPSSVEVNLGAMIDEYATEAESTLFDILTAFQARWP